MHEDAVDTHRENFNAQLLKIPIVIGDRRYFGRSDESEITWIKTQNNPFT